METKEIEKKLSEFIDTLDDLKSKLFLDEKINRLDELSKIINSPDFWNTSDTKDILTEQKNLNTIVNKYQGDKNRISLAGHSYGAIVGYKMINEHPGYFSAFVPISGWNQVTNEFKNVKVWAFHGTRDNRGGASRTTYPGACKAVDQINAMGGKAKMSPLEGMGHSHVQNKVLEQKFTSPDGKQENYVDWAMRQTKAKKA